MLFQYYAQVYKTLNHFSGTHNRLGSGTQCFKAVQVPGLTVADVMDHCSNYNFNNFTVYSTL